MTFKLSASATIMRRENTEYTDMGTLLQTFCASLMMCLCLMTINRPREALNALYLGAYLCLQCKAN